MQRNSPPVMLDAAELYLHFKSISTCLEGLKGSSGLGNGSCNGLVSGYLLPPP
ncbi:mCG1051078 [Mus musculus]|nr:mCG1051078 [Mus musculus]